MEEILNKKSELITWTYAEAMAVTLDYFKGDELAATVWLSKYALKDSNGAIYELAPDEMHRRLAREFYRIESKYPNPISEDEIFGMLDKFERIVPQGSPMSGIGNNLQVTSLSNCFVIDHKDGDSYGAIFKVDEESVQLMKRRGGVGNDLSYIRPAGIAVNNAAITSTGIFPFMERYSNSTREVAMDGRRGARMLTISIKHPESDVFIDAKLDLTKVTGANISVKVDDEFMRAVVNDTTYVQQWPVDSSNPVVRKEIKARTLWDKLIKNNHASGEPGILFWDKMISQSLPDCYKDLGFNTISTNPCVSANTWVMTNTGPSKVKDLIGVSFASVCDGVESVSTYEGFFCTGDKDLFKVTTKKGFVIRATTDHPFRKISKISRHNIKSDMIKLQDLKIGDSIRLNNNREFSNWSGKGNNDVGWLLGSLLGDGCIGRDTKLEYWGDNKFDMYNKAVTIIKNNIKHRSDLGSAKNEAVNVVLYDRVSLTSTELSKLAIEYGVNNDKTLIDELIESTSSDFYCGFLSGWFDADGTVLNNIKKGVGVRLASTIYNNLEIAQRMLARLGIISTIYKDRKPAGFYDLPDGNGGYMNVECAAFHELSISKDNLIEFKNKIGFKDDNKKAKLDSILSEYTRGLYRERFVDEIVSIEHDGNELVYDCTVYPDHQFDANGFIVSNCGEIALCDADSCRLLIVNLFGHVNNKFEKTASFDWDKFKHSVYVAQKLMDDLVDLELEKIDQIIAKIESDKESDYIKRTELELWERIKTKCIQGRRTGLGITGEGDMIAALGMKYGTEEATKFSEEVHKIMCLTAYRSSVDMARDRGKFEIYDYKREESNPYMQRIAEADPELYQDMIKYGRRNIALLTCAPTGSVSILTQTTSGIEPAFLVAYTRRRKINPNDKSTRVDFVDGVGDSWEEYNVFHHGFKQWLITSGYDFKTVEKMTGDSLLSLIEKSPYYNAMANDIDWIESVKLQGAVQKWICHSISKTCNLPADVTESVVNDVYIKAWEEGCKGFTVYRDGCRSGVLVSTDEKKEEKKPKDNHAPRRPKYLECDIHRFMNRGEQWIGFVGLYDGRPYEVFTGKAEHIKIHNKIETGKVRKTKTDEGSKYDLIYLDGKEEVIVEWLNKSFDPITWNTAKMISGILRHGMPLPYVVDLINSLNLDDEIITTWKNGVARMIKKYIEDGTDATDKKCKDCESEAVIYQEGCLICKNCGSSKCS